MWFEKKREEELTRRQWVLEHKLLLDEEIKKYAEAKKSDKVAQAYESWMHKKKLDSSPKLPSHSEARARPLSCFKEEVIHDVHRRQLSRKVQERVTSPKPRQFSPRVQMERVRKIQELRNSIASRDIMGQPRNIAPGKLPGTTRSSRNDTIKTTRNAATKPRDVTLEHSNKIASSPVPRAVKTLAEEGKAAPGVKLSVSKSDQYQHQYRIAKLAQPKQPCRKRRRKKKTPEMEEQEPLYYPVRIDNYFSPSSSTPDSGFAESPLTSPDPPSPTLLKVEDLNKLEIISLNSEESHVRTEPASNTPTKNENKTVRFSENVFYDNEHDSVSFGNTFDQLRSCIKVSKKPIAC